MAVSDSEFAEWLAADGKVRCVVAETSVRYPAANLPQPGGAVYFSNVPYSGINPNYVNAAYSVVPTLVYYDDILISIPQFTSKLRMDVNTVIAENSWGDLIISNEGGVRDGYLNCYWDGRQITLALGDPLWDRSDFRTIFVGYIDAVIATDSDTLTFRLRDALYLANKMLQQNLASSGLNAGTLYPITLGTVWNIAPVLDADTPNYEYTWHDAAWPPLGTYPGSAGAIVAGSVRDKGVAVTFTTPATYKFALTDTPAGTITADATGPGLAPADPIPAVKRDSPGYIMYYLLTYVAGLTPGTNLSTAFPTDVNYTMSGSRAPVAGFYAKENVNLISVLQQLAETAGMGFYAQGRDGVVYGGNILKTIAAYGSQFTSPPAGTITLTETSDIVQDSFHRIATLPPIYRVKTTYYKNWTVQTEVAGGTTAAMRARIAVPYSTVVADEPTGVMQTEHPGSYEPDIQETLNSETFTNSANALAAKLLDAHGPNGESRSIYELVVFGLRMIKLGDLVTIIHSRFGFSGGLTGLVVGIQDMPLENRMRLEVWR